MSDRLMGIIYEGTGGHSTRGARAVLVRGDADGYHHTNYPQRWRPTIAWAAWLAKRWAGKANRAEDREEARSRMVQATYLRLLREQGGTQ